LCYSPWPSVSRRPPSPTSIQARAAPSSRRSLAHSSPPAWSSRATGTSSRACSRAGRRAPPTTRPGSDRALRLAQVSMTTSASRARPWPVLATLLCLLVHASAHAQQERQSGPVATPTVQHLSLPAGTRIDLDEPLLPGGATVAEAQRFHGL